MSTHQHTHGAVEQPPGPSEGAVFVEVGDGVGAAVIYTEPDLEGAELEIGEHRTSGAASTRRSVSEDLEARCAAAVFGSLTEGDWNSGFAAAPIRNLLSP